MYLLNKIGRKQAKNQVGGTGRFVEYRLLVWAVLWAGWAGVGPARKGDLASRTLDELFLQVSQDRQIAHGSIAAALPPLARRLITKWCR